jgi:GTPase
MSKVEKKKPLDRGSRIDETGVERIEPEKDDGNKEYKLKLVENTQHRIDQWTSQMRFRMDEGGGECIYNLGVSDSGGLIGITEEEYKTSMEILNQVVSGNNYAMTLLSQKIVADTDPVRTVYEFLIREVNVKKYVDLKVAIAGNVDSGKSSTLGALMSGTLDNGRGSARLNVFNFEHEVKSGRTSSVAHHIIGFDEKGVIVHASTDFGKKSWPDIIRDSSKVVTFFDLCGHERYLKTTILGLTSMFPDMCIITVGANMGVTKMTKEHLFLCMTLHIPFIVLITKIDICEHRQNVLKETVTELKTLLKGFFRRVPYRITCDDDVMVTIKNFHQRSVVPIIYTSNVTGEGLPFLKQFLNLVGRSPKNIKKIEKNVEYHVETTFTVPGVGTVTGGQLVSGTISVGDKLILGPNNNKYVTIQVRSIHCKRVPVQTVEAGCYVCLGLKKIERKTIRRGNVIMSMDAEQICVKDFIADVTVMKTHSTTIKVGYEPVVHTCSVRQTAKILDIYNKKCSRKKVKEGEDVDKVLRTGDRAKVKFRFT